MKLLTTLSLTFLMMSAAAHATETLRPVVEGTAEGEAASIANKIFGVFSVKSGGYTYHVVSMDSKLNQDYGLTGMVLVGEEVGGEAGYESAFQLTPNDVRLTIKGARARRGGEVELTVFGTDFKTKKIRIKYDPASKTLTVR